MNLTVVIIVVCVVLAIALLVIFLVYGRAEANFTFDIGGGGPKASGGSDTSAETNTSKRLKGLAIISGAGFAAIIARLWSMQLLSSDEYAEQAESNRTRTISLPAPRGRILDRNGNEIVTNRSSLTVLADPDVSDDSIECQILANLIGMPALAVKRKIQDSSVGAQSQRSVAVDVSRRVVAYIAEHPYAFEGVDVDERTQRSYPYGSLAAHVVGYTGTVTAEQLESSADSEGVQYNSGDIVGQTGVELQYESVLQGIDGEQIVYVDANGNVLDYSSTVEPKSGSDVVLTIDLNIQQAAEDSIERVVAYERERGYDATGACAVAVDCTNGEVIAMASYPTYSPNVFVGGISTGDWDNLQSEDSHYPLMNRAISGQYPSGSTIKALTTLAALSYGIADASSSWYCTGWWTGFGEAYGKKCWLSSGHGSVNLVSGITYSCDIVYYEIGKGFYYADSEKQEGMQETFRMFGLGTATGIDLPSEVSGRVPDAEWKWNYWSDASEDARTWQGGDNCNLAIGQGDLLVTCLQMVDAYCGIANRGTVYRPHVLKSVKSATGDGSVIDYKPEVILTPEETDEHYDLVDRGLKGVVYEESASQASHWTNFSQTAMGKTGTAEQSTGDPIGWFIGVVPADNPKYVVGANMDRVLSGGSSAMYVVRDIMGAIYNDPDDASLTTSSTD